MSKLIELSQQNKPVGKVTDVRNGSVMEIAIFMNPRDEQDLSKGYRFSGKLTNSYPKEEERGGVTVTVWKEKKSLSGNDYLRLQNLSRQADDLDQDLKLQLKEELKVERNPVPAVPVPSL